MTNDQRNRQSIFVLQLSLLPWAAPFYIQWKLKWHSNFLSWSIHDALKWYMEIDANMSKTGVSIWKPINRLQYTTKHRTAVYFRGNKERKGLCHFDKLLGTWWNPEIFTTRATFMNEREQLIGAKIRFREGKGLQSDNAPWGLYLWIESRGRNALPAILQIFLEPVEYLFFDSSGQFPREAVQWYTMSWNTSF